MSHLYSQHKYKNNSNEINTEKKNEKEETKKD
jgi:hypothetical protein